MENNHNTSPLSSSVKVLGKNKKSNTQLKTIFQFWQKNIATAAMVSAATGIHQKNICRYKRDLEQAGMLWEIEKKTCVATGFKSWWVTTNPNLAKGKEKLSQF